MMVKVWVLRVVGGRDVDMSPSMAAAEVGRRRGEDEERGHRRGRKRSARVNLKSSWALEHRLVGDLL